MGNNDEWREMERQIAKDLSRNLVFRDYPNTVELEERDPRQLFELGIMRGWIEAQALMLARLILRRPKKGPR